MFQRCNYMWNIGLNVQAISANKAVDWLQSETLICQKKILILIFYSCSLTPWLLGNFTSFLWSAYFFQNQLFQKILSGIPSV